MVQIIWFKRSLRTATSQPGARATVLRSAERQYLLARLARAIHDMTILARGGYDRPDTVARLRETNEAIHRLAGHISALCDPAEVVAEWLVAEWRIEGISRYLAILPLTRIERLIDLSHCMQPDSEPKPDR